MNPYIEDIPKRPAGAMKRLLAPDEPTLIRVAGDMNPDRSFGESWLVATDRRVLLITRSGEDVVTEIPLDQIVEVRTETLVGGGHLELERRKDAPAHIAYSGSLAGKFADVAAGIRQILDGEEPILPERVEKTRCDTCRRPLPEKDGLCPFCIRKGATFRRILGYLGPYRSRVTLLVLITVFGTLVSLTPPLLIQRIVDDVLTPRTSIPLLYGLIGGLFVAQVLIWAVRVGRGWISVWIGGRVTADVRSQLYRHMQFMPIRFYDRRKVGTLISRITNDTERLEGLMMFGLPHIFTDGLLVLGIIILLMIKNWFLTLFVLLPIPLIVLASLLIWKRLWKSWGRWLSRWARLSSHLNESISGIRVVKAFSQEKREGQRFDQRNHELRDAGIFVDRTWYVFFTTTNFLMSFGVFFVWYIGGRQILGETMTLGALIAFISYLWMLYEPIQWLGELNSFVSRAFAGAERIFEILDKTPEKAEATDAIAMPTLEGRVRFRHVTFGYDRAKPALKDIVLDIEPGEMIGLVGRSGVGKTTLINLVCRFYDPDRGTIEIDGCDMRAIRLADLRRHIGMVHQESFLFSGTIAENIGYSKPGATLADIMEAAMAAEAHDFIVARPDGYNTLVGERGNRLSGGEKQRLAIARAILHNPRILILDEATSSLDTETEKKIQEAIARLVRGRTTLAIAHRLSTLRSADRLVVLDDGKIAEIGTHAELMEKKGFFYQMVKTQQEASASIAVGGGKDASAELVC